MVDTSLDLFPQYNNSKKMETSSYIGSSYSGSFIYCAFNQSEN